jgi:hypothetical protein
VGQVTAGIETSGWDERSSSYMEEMIVRYVIVFLIVAVLVLVVGMALAVIASDTDDWNKEFDDRDQEAYLRKWNEQRKKNKDHTCR